MPEVNGREAYVGDLIITGSQVARITAVDVDSDRLTYTITDGGGVNIVSAHLSNTLFEVLDNHGSLAEKQAEILEGHEATAKTVADPLPEDPETDRVKGKPGAKLNGRTTTPGQPTDDIEEVTDEFTTSE